MAQAPKKPQPPSHEPEPSTQQQGMASPGPAQTTPMPHVTGDIEEANKMQDLIDAQARVIGKQAMLIRYYQDLLMQWEEYAGPPATPAPAKH